MDQKALAKLQGLRRYPIVITGAIGNTTTSAKVYYVKVPVGARLVKAVALMDATTDEAKAITISKATIAATTSKFQAGSVVAAGSLTTVPVAIADTALLTGTTGTAASAITMIPSTNFSEANLAVTVEECIAISLAAVTSGKILSGVIILEFLPTE